MEIREIWSHLVVVLCAESKLGECRKRQHQRLEQPHLAPRPVARLSSGALPRSIDSERGVA